MIEKKGDDENEAISIAKMQHEGTKNNRFMCLTLADFAIAFEQYD